MSPTQPQQQPKQTPTPREQAAKVSGEVEAVITAAVIAAVAAAGGLAALAVAGYTVQMLTRLLVAFLRPLASARVLFLSRLLQQNYTDALPTGVTPFEDVIAEVFDREAEYEVTFARRSAERVVRAMERSAARGDTPEQSAEALRLAMEREARYEKLRSLAVERRVMLAVSEARVHAMSPDGAYWLMDPTKKVHTPDCIAMANKAWSWEVLSEIRPSNRHHSCGCHLIPVAMARANGKPNANMIRSSVPAAARGSHRG